MGVVWLKENGLIYKDEFTSSDLDPRWEVLPNDPTRYSLEGDFLRVYHGDSPIYLFFTPLSTEKYFVFDIKNNYNPSVDGDVGGIVVYGDDENFIEIEEYYDSVEGTTKTYPWLRLVRKYNNYSAYWSEDGLTWYFIGTMDLNVDSPKIGIYLRGGYNGTTPMGEPLDIEYVRVFKFPYVTVDNLEEGVKVELIDETGTVVDTGICKSGYTTVQFDMAKHPFPFKGNFIVTLPDGNKFQPVGSFDIYAGDVYNFELLVDLYYREEDSAVAGGYIDIYLIPNRERFLGYLNLGSQSFREVLMFVRNPFVLGTLKDITIEVIPYQTDQYINIQLAPDVDGVPGVYNNNVYASEILPGEDFKFWARLERDNTSEVFFGLRITSTYI